MTITNAGKQARQTLAEVEWVEAQIQHRHVVRQLRLEEREWNTPASHGRQRLTVIERDKFR
jgi:hypothetical protein